MAFFLVTMTHADGDGWGRHVAAHVAYLQGLIAAGKIPEWHRMFGAFAEEAGALRIPRQLSRKRPRLILQNAIYLAKLFFRLESRRMTITTLSDHRRTDLPDPRTVR
jgi:hypothetical protein